MAWYGPNPLSSNNTENVKTFLLNDPQLGTGGTGVVITVIDNKMYTEYSRITLKPIVYLGCLCPPFFYYGILSGNARKGYGYIGNITPLR